MTPSQTTGTVSTITPQTISALSIIWVSADKKTVITADAATIPTMVGFRLPASPNINRPPIYDEPINIPQQACTVVNVSRMPPEKIRIHEQELGLAKRLNMGGIMETDGRLRADPGNVRSTMHRFGSFPSNFPKQIVLFEGAFFMVKQVAA